MRDNARISNSFISLITYDFGLLPLNCYTPAVPDAAERQMQNMPQEKENTWSWDERHSTAASWDLMRHLA
jgi:hypothetical protein